MKFKPLLLLLLLVGLPADAQDLRIEGVPVTDEVTVADVDSMIEAVSSREDLDEETRTHVLEFLRESRAQIQIRLDNELAARQFAESLNTAPAELDELRAALDEVPPKSPTAESLGIDDSAALEELQQRLATEVADLAAADSQVADLKEQVEIQISRPALARERIARLGVSRKELDQVASAQAVPGEPELVTSSRILLARLRRAAEGAEINKLEQELLSQPVRLSLLQAKRDLSLRSQEVLSERVSVIRTAAVEKRQSTALLAQEAAAAAELAAADEHPVLRLLVEENSVLAGELPRRVAAIEAADDQLTQVKEEAANIDRRLTRSQQLFAIGGLSRTIGRLLIEENRTLPQVSKYRAQLRARSSRLGEIGLAQIRIQEQRRELVSIRPKVQELLVGVEADISDPDEFEEIAAEIRRLLRERRDLLLQVEDSYNVYLQILSDLDIEQRHLLETTDRYRQFLTRNLLWIPSAPVLFMGAWQDVLPAFGRAVSPARWLAASNSVISSMGNHVGTTLLFLALFVPLLAFRRPLAQRYTTIGEKVRNPSQDSIGLTFASLGIIVVRALPVPLLMITVAWFLRHTPEPSVFSDALDRSLSISGPFLFNALVFRALCAPGGMLNLHFGWQEASLKTIRHQLNRLVAIGTPLLFLTVLLFFSDIESDQSTVGRLVFIIFMVFLVSVVRPLTHPNSGVPAAYYRRFPENWSSKLRWVLYSLSVGLPLLLAVISALGYLYTSAVLAALMLETIWRLLALGVVYLVFLRWFALARRRLARQLAKEEFEAMLAAQENEAQGDSEGETPLATEEPLDIDKVDQQTKKLLRASLVVIALLAAWGIWADMLPAFAVMDQVSLWNQTATIDGAQVVVPVTLKDLMIALLVAVTTAIVSRNLPGLMEMAILQRLSLTPGSRYAIKTLVGYVVITAGTIWVLSIIGWNWSQIQWLVAALSVGLGFGLQEIVANFVSGLVILFERPVRVGDTVTVGQLTGTVSQVRIRATTITDWDRKEIIVPNKSFITEQVVNWTLTDPITRIVVEVSISYGSDVEKARGVMLQTLSSVPAVLDDPEPKVYFMRFGESSLDFILHAYSRQLSDRLPMIDEVHRAILAALRENNIQIPFPQHDLHIKTNTEAK